MLDTGSSVVFRPRSLVARRNPCIVAGVKPAQLEALAGTGLLIFSAFKRGGLGMLAFLGAATLIVHATLSRAKEGFR
jgi:hypothetical protein